jgi:hypothetical protein
VQVDVLGRVLAYRVHRLQQDLRFGHDFALGFALQRLGQREPAQHHSGKEHQREQQRELGA